MHWLGNSDIIDLCLIDIVKSLKCQEMSHSVQYTQAPTGINVGDPVEFLVKSDIQDIYCGGSVMIMQLNAKEK